MFDSEIGAGLWALSLLAIVWLAHVIPDAVRSVFEEPEWWKEFFKEWFKAFATFSVILAVFLFLFLLSVVITPILLGPVNFNWYALVKVSFFFECITAPFSGLLAFISTDSPDVDTAPQSPH